METLFGEENTISILFGGLNNIQKSHGSLRLQGVQDQWVRWTRYQHGHFAEARLGDCIGLLGLSETHWCIQTVSV